MLKRLLVFILISMVFNINIAFTADIKSKIKNISISGIFENSKKDPHFISGYLLPVDGKPHQIEFTYDTTTYLIPFKAALIKTISEKEGRIFSDEVRIEYSSLLQSDLYRNDAILKFEGYDKNGKFMPIDEVIDYMKADFIASGWLLKTDVFPIKEIVFTTKHYSDNKGATDWAWFIIHFSYPASGE